MSFPFLYPAEPHVRRHGPQGYSDYASYRPWLRDEFAFRCVYCLLRERWVIGGFHLDHFHPRATYPEKGMIYENLIYCCAVCNQVKNLRSIPNPTHFLIESAISVLQDGTILAQTREAKRIVARLGLNSARYCEFRRLWIAIAAAVSSNSSLRVEAFGYPTDLPDLSNLRPPEGNSKPEGIETSHFRRRQHGELPETY